MSNFFNSVQTGKPQCLSCGLHSKVKSPKIPLSGKGNKGIFILSEEPSETEDFNGETLSGASGFKLESILKDYGIDLHNDCWKANAVRCHVGEGDSLKYVGKCKNSIHKMIDDCKPSKIFLLGTVALSSYYFDRPEVIKSISANRGLSFWDSDRNCWVFPLFHPALYTDTRDSCMVASAKFDLDNAIKHSIDPPIIPEPIVKKLVTVDSVLEYLQYLLDEKPIFSFDYEATGIKPQYKGHKAVSVGICTNKGAVSFPLMHVHWKKDEQHIIIDRWKAVLHDVKIKKVVQAMNMESVWSHTLFGGCKGIIWDTQLASHVLDNREGIYYGLKFQAFLRWGVKDYSLDVEPYIKSVDGSKFNRMEKVPVGKLLLYNGLDALYTYHLWKKQAIELIGKELSAYRFFHRGLELLGEMHMNGICMNVEYYRNQLISLSHRISKLQTKIATSQEALDFSKKFHRTLSVTSPDDLSDLFFVLLKITSNKQTSGGKFSTDEEVLKSIEHPIADTILRIRKLEKIRGTYIEGFLREEAQGFIHPVFSLHRVITFRSSSQNPNFQNLSKRNKEAKKIIRSGLIPRPNSVIGEGDFSGAEVCVSGTYHRDKNYINYLLDKKTDMHRDCAKDLWLLNEIWDELDKVVAKDIRQNTKSDWTFAEFYGAKWKKCAVAMWKKRNIVVIPQTETTLEQHLASKNIKSEKVFFDHVKKFEEKFWTVMFPEYDAWKKNQVNTYIRNGFIETYLGFKFKGYMNEREVSNYPIQGTSFHLLLYVGCELNKQLKRAGMKTKLIGQIHDSLIADIPLDEVVRYAQMLKAIMATLQDKFEWLVVPINIEFEISRPREEGGSFAEMEEIDMKLIGEAKNYSDIIFVATKDQNGVEARNSKRIPYTIN